jgi:LysR family glycine cleavage system transcriptional activator
MKQRLPPLNALHVFATVARELNMTRAADRLNVTQSAVSRQVSQLEDYLGQPLFVRRARGLELNAAGRQLLPAVDSAFDGIARAVARLAPRPAELRLKLPPTLAMRWLLPRLADFQRRYPGIEIRMSTGDCDHVRLDAEDLDAAILYSRSAPEPYAALPLFAEQLVAVCAPAAAARLRQPADIARESLIHLSADHADWRAWLTLAGVSHPALESGPSFEVIDMAVNLAGRDQGVALADPVLIADDLASGRLLAPFPDIAIESGVRYWFVCARSRQAEAPLVALRDWLQENTVETVQQLGRLAPRQNAN